MTRKKWHEIALCLGTPVQDNLSFEINIEVPEPIDNKPATSRQIDSVEAFYKMDASGLSYCQAHALLSAKEYARLCGDIIFKDYHPKLQKMLSPCLAAYVLSDEDMITFVKKWSDRNFENGTSTPRVRGTVYFPDMEYFAEYLSGTLELNGWFSSRFF